MNRRVGIYGGTFDPPHVGHILIAQEALQRHDLNKVLFVVSGDPWQKSHQKVTPAELRWDMLIEALSPWRSWAQPSRVEIDREGPSYMVDTLLELQRPDEDHFLILGDDIDLTTWKDWERIKELATLSWHKRWLNVSSTKIRDRIRRGLPVTGLIHSEVYEYILNADLYRGPDCECLNAYHHAFG
jgi:nicotinate-nucleotide adenylyltransferase